MPPNFEIDAVYIVTATVLLRRCEPRNHHASGSHPRYHEYSTTTTAFCRISLGRSPSTVKYSRSQMKNDIKEVDASCVPSYLPLVQSTCGCQSVFNNLQAAGADLPKPLNRQSRACSYSIYISWQVGLPSSACTYPGTTHHWSVSA
ncbi:hypothetical protein K503DRAFT_587898 [Rhizopogon vinicolor AM-OR11-026]|uniref:Uncharacterized protein n=1 Tax=Rhizopogon vinicolor AM-OR11-026 TaxID=1314800 RepID=A0A1B7MJB4_9AGAM|nr:hypothetical protein K503DRAFT_587898 [Rhizopogon vinicolor AM-OR11-026]